LQAWRRARADAGRPENRATEWGGADVRGPDLSRRTFLTLVAGVPILLALPSGLVLAATLRVRKLRHWSAPDHTRIVIELDAAGRFETRTYTDPDRVVVEIPGARADAFEVPVDDGLVRSLSVTTLGGSVLVRVVLARAADYAAFPLAPNAASEQHRIVLDVRKRLTAAESQAQEREVETVRESGDVVVAIDAGHGGNDPGCSGHDLVEKEITLAVARQFADALGGRPRLRPLLTRQRDYFVPLGQRQKIAQRYGAKLFVSIHCNAAASLTARGSEVFFVSLQGAADKAAKELVDRENAADLVGGVAPQEVQTPLVDILVNLKQNDAMRRSERLGEMMLRRLEQVPGNESRGLKQGPLAVLKSITCPSVLVELGFVTNRQDARLLADRAGQRHYAQEMAASIDEYLRATG
jgi:N-acetylmuramoyl-L-alanine amidase